MPLFSCNFDSKGVLYRYVGLLRFAVHPAGAGKGLFFSYGVDLTRTQQRRTDSGTQLDMQKADNRFFFNQILAKPLIGGQV